MLLWRKNRPCFFVCDLNVILLSDFFVFPIHQQLPMDSLPLFELKKRKYYSFHTCSCGEKSGHVSLFVIWVLSYYLTFSFPYSSTTSYGQFVLVLGSKSGHGRLTFSIQSSWPRLRANGATPRNSPFSIISPLLTTMQKFLSHPSITTISGIIFEVKINLYMIRLRYIHFYCIVKWLS